MATTPLDELTPSDQETFKRILQAHGLADTWVDGAIDLIEAGFTTSLLQEYETHWGQSTGFTPSALIRLNQRGLTPQIAGQALIKGHNTANEAIQDYTLFKTIYQDRNVPSNITDKAYLEGKPTTNPDWLPTTADLEKLSLLAADVPNATLAQLVQAINFPATGKGLENLSGEMKSLAPYLENMSEEELQELLTWGERREYKESRDVYPASEIAEQIHINNLHLADVLETYRQEAERWENARLYWNSTQPKPKRVEKEEMIRRIQMLQELRERNPDEGKQLLAALSSSTTNLQYAQVVIDAFPNMGYGAAQDMLKAGLNPNELLKLKNAFPGESVSSLRDLLLSEIKALDDEQAVDKIVQAKNILPLNVWDLAFLSKGDVLQEVTRWKSIMERLPVAVTGENLEEWHMRDVIHDMLRKDFTASLAQTYMLLVNGFDHLSLNRTITEVSLERLDTILKCHPGISGAQLYMLNRRANSTTSPEADKTYITREYWVDYIKNNPEATAQQVLVAWKNGLSSDKRSTWERMKLTTSLNTTEETKWKTQYNYGKEEKPLTRTSLSIDEALEASGESETYQLTEVEEQTPGKTRVEAKVNESDLSEATRKVEALKEQYGTYVSDFDTYFNLPSLMDKDFKPLGEFIQTLVNFQDTLIQIELKQVSSQQALLEAEKCEQALKTAIEQASEIGNSYLIERPEILTVIASCAKTRKLANEGATEGEREAAKQALENTLPKLADLLGGPKALNDRLAIEQKAAPNIKINRQQAVPSQSR